MNLPKFIFFVIPLVLLLGKVKPHQKVVDQVAKRSKQLPHEWPKVVMEDVTQRPQITHEQALFPHDVLLMPADQLACTPPRKSSAGTLMFIDEAYNMTPRCCTTIPLQA